jgi:threonine dehydrogenase-like Zn-dependent dehydrogenase
MKTMQGVWLDGALSVRADLPLPRAGPGWALVRVRLAGICGTDLQLLRGYYPFRGVIGHEFVGEIVEAETAPERVGERVVGEINLGCGGCVECLAGRPGHCEKRKVVGLRDRDGAFAQWLALPLGNLHRVPDAVPDEAAVFAEPLAAALAITQQVSLRPEDRVLLVGAGRLGQLIARVLVLHGCDLAVVARHRRQRELLEAAGIPWVDEASALRGGCDMVVEATGSPQGLELARRALRARGTLVLKSTYRGSVTLDLASLVVNEQRLVGSRCGPFAPALRLLGAGLVDPLPLIEVRYPLVEAPAALARAAGGGVLKVLLDCAG